jgi:hypothetical protein
MYFSCEVFPMRLICSLLSFLMFPAASFSQFQLHTPSQIEVPATRKPKKVLKHKGIKHRQ